VPGRVVRTPSVAHVPDRVVGTLRVPEMPDRVVRALAGDGDTGQQHCCGTSGQQARIAAPAASTFILLLIALVMVSALLDCPLLR